MLKDPYKKHKTLISFGIAGMILVIFAMPSSGIRPIFWVPIAALVLGSLMFGWYRYRQKTFEYFSSQ